MRFSVSSGVSVFTSTASTTACFLMNAMSVCSSGSRPILLFSVPAFEEHASVHVAETKARFYDVFELLLDHLVRDAVSDRNLRMHVLAVDRGVNVAVDDLVDDRDAFKSSRG